jgi:hypothetical protein
MTDIKQTLQQVDDTVPVEFHLPKLVRPHGFRENCDCASCGYVGVCPLTPRRARLIIDQARNLPSRRSWVYNVPQFTSEEEWDYLCRRCEKMAPNKSYLSEIDILIEISAKEEQ